MKMMHNPHFIPFEFATIRRVFHFKDNRTRDKDNFDAMTKAASDGIVMSGLMKDDTGITWQPTKFIVDGSKFLEYEIFELH